MTVNEAKKLVEDKYPNLKAAYAIPLKGKYLFNMLDRKTGRVVYNSSLLSVDENSGEIKAVSIINDDLDGYDEAASKDIVYFSKEGMDMATMKVL